MSKSKPISIVIVTYNSSEYVIKLLKSLEKCELLKNIFLIENNSSDASETQKLVKGYIKKTGRNQIKIVMNENNYGFGKSCNIGANLSTTKYLLFLNPDTMVSGMAINVLYEHALRTDADLIGGKSISFHGKQHLTVVRKPSLNIGLFEFTNLGKFFNTQRGNLEFYYLDRKDITEAKKDVRVDGLGGAYLMVKKSSFKKLNGFDEKFFMYLEDVDLSTRANFLKMKVVYCPHSTIQHVGGASSKNKYKIRHQAWFDSRKYYFKRHFGFFVNLIIQPLYITEEFLLKKIRNV